MRKYGNKMKFWLNTLRQYNQNPLAWKHCILCCVSFSPLLAECGGKRGTFRPLKQTKQHFSECFVEVLASQPLENTSSFHIRFTKRPHTGLIRKDLVLFHINHRFYASPCQDDSEVEMSISVHKSDWWILTQSWSFSLFRCWATTFQGVCSKAQLQFWKQKPALPLFLIRQQLVQLMLSCQG